MLQIANIRKNAKEIADRLSIRGLNGEALMTSVIQMDERNRSKRTEMESLQAKGNQITAQIGEMYKTGKKEEGDALKIQSTEIKESLKQLESEVEVMDQELIQLLLTIPNAPSVEVPQGKTPEENKQVFLWGDMPKLHPGALPHWELAAKYDIIDFELGVKVTGAEIGRAHV